jgi:hypothetical protein
VDALYCVRQLTDKGEASVNTLFPITFELHFRVALGFDLSVRMGTS